MKKILKSLLLTVVALLTLMGFVSCSAESKSKPQYLVSAANMLVSDDEKMAETPVAKPSINREGSKLSVIEQQDCDAVFDKINNYYGIKVGRPKVLKSSFSKYYCLDSEFASSSMMVTALFDDEAETIYLFDDLSEWNTSMLAHEYLHYIAHKFTKRDGEVGFSYKIGNHSVGTILNEGVCNYLSTKVFAHPAGTSIYEFETYCAGLISCVIGEEALAEAYFTGNLDLVMNSFNTALAETYANDPYGDISLTPFDQFVIILKDYYTFLSQVGDAPSVFLPAVRVTANCITEMFSFYGDYNGEEVKSAMVTKTNELIINSFMIDWTNYTDIKKIMKN